MLVRMTIGLLGTLGLIFTFFWVGINEEERMEAWTAGNHGRAIERGAALYANNCAECHGDRGEGRPAVGPALNDPHFFTNRLEEVGYVGTLESYVKLTVAAGRPIPTDDVWVQTMPTWSQDYGGPLRRDQVRDVVAFVMNWEDEALERVDLEPTPTPTPRPVVDPDEIDPVTLLEVQGCLACHAIDSPDVLVGPSLWGIGTVAAERVPDLTAEEYIRRAIINPGAFVVPGFPAGVMPANYEDRLSEEELGAIVEFLLTLRQD